MCLIVKGDGTPNIANRDIVCYKAVWQFSDRLCTYYRDVPIKLGKQYRSKLVYDYGEVEIGLHSLSSKEEARRLFNHAIVVKCIIPKGSRYYVGTFGSSRSYASNKIKYLEIIKE